MCLPCAKQIINQQAQTALYCVHEQAELIPEHVKTGRLSAVDAEQFLKTRIRREKAIIAEANEDLGWLTDRTKSPWEDVD